MNNESGFITTQNINKSMPVIYSNYDCVIYIFCCSLAHLLFTNSYIFTLERFCALSLSSSWSLFSQLLNPRQETYFSVYTTFSSAE